MAVLTPEQEIDAEVGSIMRKFCTRFKRMFMNNGESYYKIAALCGKDTKTLKDMLEKAINCELRSMVQCLYKFGFTIEIRIVRRKSLNGNAQIELEGRKTGIA